MFAQILLPLIVNLTMLTVVLANCGGKKKGAAAAAGGPPSNDSKKQPPGGPSSSKADKPSEKKDVDDGNYEELAVPQ